jgi:hypothetical protein
MIKRRDRAPQIGLATAAILLPLLFLASGAYADVPIPGMKGYDNNYVISNIGDYPNYLFLTSSTIWGWKYTSLIDHATGSFGGGYKLDGFYLHAAKESDFNESIFSASSGDNRIDCTDYCKGNQKIVSSDIDLPVSKTVNNTIPLSQITVYLKVNSINDTDLDVTMGRIVYTYSNGTSLEAPLQSIK